MDDDIFGDAPDIRWLVEVKEGIPFLVLHATGPAMSAAFIMADFKSVKCKYIYDTNKLPQRVPQSFVVYEGDDILCPILIAEPDHPELAAFMERVRAKVPWVLVLQYLVEGKPQARFFVTTEGVTTPFAAPGGPLVIDHWIAPHL